MGNLNFKSMKHYESGFSVPYNVKDIQAIQVKDGWSILVGINDDQMRTFSVGRKSSPTNKLALAK